MKSDTSQLTLLGHKTVYKQDFDTANMPKSVIEAYYQTEAPHTMYMGEVLEIIEKK